MGSPQPKNANVRLLACLVDDDNVDNNDYRFLVDGKYAKYISTAPGTFRGCEGDCTFEPILLGELLPPFPAGHWNNGYIANDPQTGMATFTKTETVTFAGVRNLWCPVKLNELDFTRQVRMNQRVHVSTHPKVNSGKPVVVKIAVWPCEIPSIEAETTAYQWIRNSGIGPKFLGHLTEGKNGRVIGIVTEFFEGARPAGPEDIDGCLQALSRLHRLGIKLGDVNRHNFLVRDGVDVTLVDFETAKRGCSLLELDAEMSALRSNLQVPDSQNGVRQGSDR